MLLRNVGDGAEMAGKDLMRDFIRLEKIYTAKNLCVLVSQVHYFQ